MRVSMEGCFLVRRVHAAPASLAPHTLLETCGRRRRRHDPFQVSAYEGRQAFGSATFSALQRRWRNQFRRANWSIGRCRRRCLVFHIAHSSFRGPSVGEWNVLPFKAMYDLLLEQSTWKVGDDRFCSCMEAVFEVIDSAR